MLAADSRHGEREIILSHRIGARRLTSMHCMQWFDADDAIDSYKASRGLPKDDQTGPRIAPFPVSERERQQGDLHGTVADHSPIGAVPAAREKNDKSNEGRSRRRTPDGSAGTQDASMAIPP
jgi:hypothetical protein